MLDKHWFLPCSLPLPWLYQPETQSSPCLPAAITSSSKKKTRNEPSQSFYSGARKNDSPNNVEDKKLAYVLITNQVINNIIIEEKVLWKGMILLSNIARPSCSKNFPNQPSSSMTSPSQRVPPWQYAAQKLKEITSSMWL